MLSPAPGWYPHPHDAAMLRWWDGDAWTDHVQPRPDTAPAPAADSSFERTLAPVGASGGEVRSWDAHDASDSFGGTEVLRDVTAPWHTDLEPSIPDVDDSPGLTNGNGHAYAGYSNGNGNGNGNGTAATAVQEKRAPFDPPPWPETPPAGADLDEERPGRLRRVLIAGLLVLVVAIGGGVAYKQGLLDSVIGGSSRTASSATVAVYEGETFSFEAPKAWSAVSTSATKFEFLAPDSTSTGIEVSPIEAGVDMTNPAVRQFMIDSAVKAFEIVLPGMPVQRSAPYQSGDIDGMQFILAGTTPEGQSGTMVLTVFTQGESVYAVGMGRRATTEDLSTNAEYNALLESFRFAD